MPVRKLPSGSYQIDIKLKGQPRYRRVHPEARNKADAKLIESRLLQQFFDRKWRPRYGEELFEDFCNNTYLPMARSEKRSWAFDEIFINQVLLYPHLKGKKLIEITPEDIRSFRDTRAMERTRGGELRAKSTVKREMAMLQRIFSYAVEVEKLQVNPCRKVKTPYAEEGRTRVLSKAEEAAILEVLQKEAPHVVPVVKLALQTGMRRGEILNLKPEYLDLDIKTDLKGNVLQYGAINLPGHICKSGKPRSVPLTEEARSILLAFTLEVGRLIFRGRGYTLNYVSHLFTWAARRVGIDDATFHTLRHTFGTRLADAGTHPATIKAILGHASLQMTDRYVHPDDEAKHRAARALESHGQAEVIEFQRANGRNVSSGGKE